MSLIVPHFAQQTESHCGPAVIAMLLARFHIAVTQDEIVAAARIKSRILRLGSRPDHLGRAVEHLAPGYRLWFKNFATATDLHKLVNDFHVPVGINWQGLFYSSVEEETRLGRNDDHGHYSIVVAFNQAKNVIKLVDPFFEASIRTFTYSWFKTRWWDLVPEKNPFYTKRFLYVVLPENSPIPSKFHMLESADFMQLKAST